MELLDDAEKDFLKALEFSPENLVVMFNLIEVREKLERYDEVLNDLDFLAKKIKDYTNYIYLHVKGEPLLQKKFFFHKHLLHL